jgi:hypothetical protein
MTHNPNNKKCRHEFLGLGNAKSYLPCTCPDDSTRTFSDFIRNGTPEEKKKVFDGVIQESIKDQTEKHLESCDGDCSCSDYFFDAESLDNPAPIPDFSLCGDWLTIGDAPSFMLSKKNAERLRDYVNLIEELQVNSGGSSTN